MTYARHESQRVAASRSNRILTSLLSQLDLYPAHPTVREPPVANPALPTGAAVPIGETARSSQHSPPDERREAMRASAGHPIGRQDASPLRECPPADPHLWLRLSC